MSDRALFGALTALVAIAIIAAGFVSMYPGAVNVVSSSSSASGATSSTGSILGGSQTILATLAPSTMTSASGTSTTSSSAPTSTMSSTSTSITSSISTTSSSSGGGSYSVTPSSQVQVISVAAIVSQEGGSESVTFSVQFKNIGDGDIYVLNGGGSGLNVTVTSGASLLRQVATPRCEIAVAMTPVSPGSSWTSIVPGCWSGYSYELVGSGTIGVEFQLSWSSGGTPATGGSSVMINATFPL